MSQVKKLTRLGSDTRKIAALLQAKAPKGEMLAYINPQEAALLKSRGGSGKPHADTGIPSFQVESDFSEAYMADMGRSDFEPQGSVMYLQGGPAADYQMGYPEPTFMQPAPTVSAPPADMAPAFMPAALPEIPAVQQPLPTPSMPSFLPPAVEGYQLGGMETGRVGQQPSALNKLASALNIDKGDLAKFGLAGLQTILGSRQARQATQQGQQARREMEAMAAPYRQRGEQLQAQAARGELTPQAQQSLQAVQAQAAQGVANRGGVGANQAAAQVEAVRQQLLQTQADYGLKLSGIADQIVTGAIREGLRADQFVNQLTSSYMNNIMRTVGGMATQQQQPNVTGGGR
jgi:hypothetical protein